MQPTPVRIQRSRQHKQISPNGLPIVYCGRGSKYGNPFIVGKEVPDEWFSKFTAADKLTYFTRGREVPDKKEAVRLFNNYRLINLDLSELKGKNLSCWCKEEPCHATILLKLANK